MTTAPHQKRDGTQSGVVPVQDVGRRTHLRLLRKVAVAIGGAVLVIAGLAMLVLPGPGIVVTLAGLG
ncbi:PGPGW domain-containing protein, partial [Actinomadura adrarensis]